LRRADTKRQDFAVNVTPLFFPGPKGESVQLALGTMNFGKRTPAALSERIIARALERGITVFDTANTYNDGESERIVGHALAKVRDRVRIATKCGFARVSGKSEGLSRAAIMEAFEGSRTRLGTDVIDLYYLHGPDPSVDVGETLDAIHALLASGKARAWGVSNFASWQVLELFQLCDRRAMPRPVVAQQLYNVLVRQLDIEFFRFARSHPIHTCVYNPLAGGLLATPRAAFAPPPKGSRFDGNKFYQRRYWTPRLHELAAAYSRVAESESMTLLELAYAFVAQRDGVDSILVGPSEEEHVDAAIDACEKRLSSEVLGRIDALHREYLGTDATYAR
jgi:aryl-alcohol dehydrogenase-like predicted oxidoreductase